MGKDITFEQASFIAENQDLITSYTEKFYSIMREFASNTLLQLLAGSIWMELIELSEPMHNKDYSQYLFKKLDGLFINIEELQADPAFDKIKNILLGVIKDLNTSKEEI